ncbi:MULTISPECIES: response regulator transcription factor [unclassified Ruegeria]|uniref:response regulator transcription factor n=1 Tax=unclassified Ruegeria TaxID=2625375 RepID=UPI001489F124|nr:MULTISPECIES: response regulator transcription factor [unclassified Ruegeria]NOD37050.1 response regulator [Ruegeria sp. HKCCD7296]NOD49863.1 response regulator [Ruegeria sp. HKCCD5849]NOD54166.1 response regulator [Ruegeria sp. HKCCD5851]NOD70236.1 response regulator [Ruegeria sp. HKCCD7303]NOE34506.1 response regulator [Ruegeria sp. HKCCD7318]
MRIVIIEDNETLANAIAYRLRDRGHAAEVLADGDEADLYLAQEGADLVVLDINLPGQSGLEILKSLRNRGDGVPVILLTARAETSDRVSGLDMGADDYLVKPFEMDELEARIRALSRRKDLDYGAKESIGGLEFDRAARQVSVRGEVMDIPRREIAVLECLLERRGRIVPKSQLTDYVYGVGADVEASAVEPHVSRLRKRLQDLGIGIKTARGLGYLLEVQK